MSKLSRRGLLAAAAAATATATAAAPAPLKAAPEQPAARQSPKFKLGLVTYMVAAAWDVPTILRVCQATGVAAVELRTTHAHGVEPSLNQEQRQTVRKQFEDAGVVLWGCGTTCEFHSPDEAVVAQNIETCKRFVELVHDIGGKGVKVRPNKLVEGVPPEKTLEQIGKALIPCGEAAKAAGVEIWVEVHGPGTAEPANVKTYMEACGHESVGITWNSNADDVKNGSVAEAYQLLRKWIRSVHINTLYKDQSGAYPYRELFQLLAADGYDRYTLCEVGTNFPEPALGEEFLRYYHALWAELAGA